MVKSHFYTTLVHKLDDSDNRTTEELVSWAKSNDSLEYSISPTVIENVSTLFGINCDPSNVVEYCKKVEDYIKSMPYYSLDVDSVNDSDIESEVEDYYVEHAIDEGIICATTPSGATWVYGIGEWLGYIGVFGTSLYSWKYFASDTTEYERYIYKEPVVS